jgi:Protein of unknown function (DUF3043)
VALFRRNTPPEPAPPVPVAPAGPGAKKDRPTPTRKEAEAARRQRVTRTVSKREARLEASRHSRAERMRLINAREAAPEKVLLRDYVDSRFNLGEFLLPSLVVILATTFLGQMLPRVAVISTLAMYAFIFAVIADTAIMWRGFKKLLAARLPKASPRGLLMYGMNRGIQIRRFRMPRPRVKRGDKI